MIKILFAGRITIRQANKKGKKINSNARKTAEKVTFQVKTNYSNLLIYNRLLTFLQIDYNC